jgi:hypothetical protein
VGRSKGGIIMKLNKGEYITLYLKGDNIMLKMSNLFKNNEYEALFRFAYAPEKFIKIDDFNFDEFKNEIIAGICKDVVIDLKYGDYTTRLKRRPRISFEECFKSKELMIVFFLFFGLIFLSGYMGVVILKKIFLKLLRVQKTSLNWQ